MKLQLRAAPFYKSLLRPFSQYSRIKSCMFVPGNNEKMLLKSYSINSHVIVPDLEDSVPLSEKEKARKLISRHIKNISESDAKRLVFPRLNSVTSNLFHTDVDELLTKENSDFINGFVIPKVNTAEEFEYIDNKMLNVESKLEVKRNKIKLIIWIESPMGIINMKEILSKNSGRIVAAAFGAEDFCNDFGIERTEHLKEVEVARSLFAMTAHAFRILPLDTPNVDFKNPESIIKEIDYVKSLGFKGKFAIHPSQVEIINKLFSPSEREVQEARVILEEFERGMKEGKGAISLNGKMVDIPVYKRALNIIERSKV